MTRSLGPGAEATRQGAGRLGAVVIVAALVAARFWLGANQSITALGPASHDDRLFLRLASNLASGKWLGGYSAMTLVKGPLYPLWIALCFGLGAPLLAAEHALYIAASALFSVAFRPVLPSGRTRIALFGALLFNPASFADGPMSRVVREGIYPALTLLSLGSAIGLALRVEGPMRTDRRWPAGLGASLAAFWLCREERVWLAPALLAVVALAAWRRPRWRAAARALGVAALVFAVAVGAVVARNRARYGVAVITEFTEGPFPAAYAALARVRHAAPRARVPLPAEARARLYAASPSFAELAPSLEGPTGRNWVRSSCAGAGICDDLGGGWTMWALRDAAFEAGHYRAGRDAAAYWGAVAREVGRACDEGRLACGRGGSGFLPPLRSDELGALPGRLATAASSLASFDGVSARRSQSEGQDALLVDFLDLTRSRLAPSPGSAAPPLPRQALLESQQLAFLEGVTRAYQRAVPPLALAAVIAWLAAAAVAVARRRLSALFLVTTALGAALATRLVVVVLVDVTSFPAVNSLYLSPAYPILLGFVALSFAAALEVVRAPRATADARQDVEPQP